MKDVIYFKSDEKDYRFEKPSADILNKADQVYSTKMSELIASSRKGKQILLRSQLDEFLEEQGIWTEKDEIEIFKIQEEYQDLDKKLKKGGIKLSEGREISIKMFKLTNSMIQLNAKRRALDDTTAESIADKEQQDYIIYACTFTEPERKPVWKTFEDMKEDKGSDVYFNASSSYIQVMYGSNKDFLSLQPEVSWLKEYGFINDEMKFVDRKTGELVDINGKKIETEEAVENFQPFIDDETGEPIVTGELIKEEPKETILE